MLARLRRAMKALGHGGGIDNAVIIVFSDCRVGRKVHRSLAFWAEARSPGLGVVDPTWAREGATSPTASEPRRPPEPKVEGSNPSGFVSSSAALLIGALSGWVHFGTTARCVDDAQVAALRARLGEPHDQETVAIADGSAHVVVAARVLDAEPLAAVEARNFHDRPSVRLLARFCSRAFATCFARPTERLHDFDSIGAPIAECSESGARCA